jgi:2-oxoacid:acceptor oxidoreductase gamma subunit (pyruvate/2-ketoisovalerate family)/2-oxoacid:acceptor oxidoreductase delta subunit (pyruvate/2-ketoisovalerate family)
MNMLEIRFHGRGGQGAVTSAELLAQAAILEGKQARAFPSFGPERRGAPVTAYCRISDRPLRLRTVISEPDIVLVLDPSLFDAVDVTAGLKDNGILVINTKNDPKHFAVRGVKQVATVDATHIAMEVLKRPITNTVLLGALIRVCAIVDMDSIVAATADRFKQKIAASNIEALHKAYAETLIFQEEPRVASYIDETAAEKAPAEKSQNAAAVKGAPSAATYRWHELEPGCVIADPGNAVTYHTGDWRTFFPQLYKERCIKCGLCWIFCPDMAYNKSPEGFYLVALDYCKGCGICARECPTGAISMVEEKEPIL